jgi:hypothetical protein
MNFSPVPSWRRGMRPRNPAGGKSRLEKNSLDV